MLPYACDILKSLMYTKSLLIANTSDNFNYKTFLNEEEKT